MKTHFNRMFILLLLALTSSCVSYDNLVNYKDSSTLKRNTPIVNPPEIKIQPDDILDIKVHSQDMAMAASFNLNAVSSRGGLTNLESTQLNGYLVDKHGSIDFPVLGRVDLKGHSIAAAKEKIVKQLDRYLNNPIVNLRLINFKVTVSGEVSRPGSFTILSERITLPEAISRAGDLTNYANRSNVLVIREDNGIRSLNRVNLQSNNLFRSDFYYLKQNDLIYVEPLQAKTGSIRDQTNETITFITAAATLVAVLIGILR